MKNTTILGLIIILMALVAGCTQPINQITNTEQTLDNGLMDETNGLMQDDTSHNGEAMDNENEAMNGEAMAKPTYIPFNQEAYETARNEGKIIFLEFYANWCPSCRVQEPRIEQAFSEMTNPKIVGFRVNYNDSETDDNERNLAREFGITYQHTHVLLDAQGNVQKKSLDLWTSQQVKEELAKIAGSV